LVENKGRGLGLMGEWKGSPQWHGGNIEQLAQLLVLPDGQGKKTWTFQISLKSPALTMKSRLLSRFMGSRHIIQVSLKKLDTYDEAQLKAAREFLSLPLILLGRTFILFHIKENNNAWFIETISPLDSSFAVHPSDSFRHSYRDIVKWFNPAHERDNRNQVGSTLSHTKITTHKISSPLQSGPLETLWPCPLLFLFLNSKLRIYI
jgi:RNA-dependent RNA polymerase